MPEIAMQVEIKDTHRNVYTQWGATGGVIASVIVEYKKFQEINTHSRTLSSMKRKQPRKPGMKVSEVNTEKIKTHRTCVETEDMLIETNEGPEIIILKEINNLECNRVQSQAAPNEERKRTWRKANPSRQEKLYADILAGEVKRKRGAEGKENKDKRLSERQTRDEERRRMKRIREEETWLEKPTSWVTSDVANTQVPSKSADAASPTCDRGIAVGGWTREYKSGMLDHERHSGGS